MQSTYSREEWAPIGTSAVCGCMCTQLLTYESNSSIPCLSDIKPFSPSSSSSLGLNQLSPQLGQSRFEDANMVGSGFVPLRAGHLGKESEA